MYIHQLRLEHFRNLSHIDFSPSPGCNVLVGDNAQGKTGLLEAIYFCSMGKSHRTTHDADLIQYHQPYAVVRCGYRRKSVTHQTNVYVEEEQKKITIDDQPITKLSDLIGKLNSVIFSPEDLRLSKGGPLERRRFMDRCMCQIDPEYFYNLTVYDKNLKMRSAELKNGGKHLDIWDAGLSKSGVVLHRHRQQFVGKLRRAASPVITQLASGEDLTLEYQSCDVLQDEQSYLAALAKARERDQKNFSTSLGPHRDDIVIKINGKDVRSFGSQGQQRTAALCLKLAELEIMKAELDDSPILLLDDVMSELDQSRQRHLIGLIGGLQSFITTTQLDFDHSGSVFQVSRGQIVTK